LGYRYARASREVTNLSTIYEAVCNSEFVEELHQTDAKEFWSREIAVLEQLCRSMPVEGLFFTHNPQILANSYSLHNLQIWFFTPSHTALLATKSLPIQNTQTIRLAKNDAISHEWFCLLISRSFSLLILASDQSRSCIYTFHPEPIQKAIAVLRQKIYQPAQVSLLSQQLEQFPVQMPEYRVIAKLGTLLLSQSFRQELPIPEIREVDLIRAIAHEVKTPLTTIRTLVHSLLRRKDTTTAIKTRLEQIAMECSDQIDRFNLIFEAAQLAAAPVPLERIQFQDVLLQSIKRWQEQSQRRHIEIHLDVPQDLPAAISNSHLLQQLLNGLVDRLTRGLPIGSHILIQVSAAGEHLKLQFHSQFEDEMPPSESPLLRAVGQWLMLQPETGTLSLSLPITKTLFQAIGGKFTVRLHPTSGDYDGEILTIFLPIDRG
jgi:signal transduction histidine kinase